MYIFFYSTGIVVGEEKNSSAASFIKSSALELNSLKIDEAAEYANIEKSKIFHVLAFFNSSK